MVKICSYNFGGILVIRRAVFLSLMLLLSLGCAVAADTLTVGNELTWSASDEEEMSSDFTSQSDGQRFQSLQVYLSGGEIRLQAHAEIWQGEYCRSINYDKYLSAEKANHFILDDMPQEAGEIEWTFQWSGASDGDTLTLSLLESVEMPAVKVGESLGALRVRGIDYGKVSVIPTGPVEVTHPDINEDSFFGDMTPEGDTLFWLPAGYWTVQSSCGEEEVYVDLICNRFIPVSSGEMTILEMPPSLSIALNQPESIQAEETAGGIEIISAVEEGPRARLTFALLDHGARDLVPALDNLEVYEGDAAVEILEIRHLSTPPNIVLLLDSSGSMKNQMSEVLAAAGKFITGLPDDAIIKVVDFDTEPRVLAGSNKAEVLKSLEKVKANGATALYDTTLVGLDLLKGKSRPTLLVFTDGVDANYDDSGPGSTATGQEVLAAVKSAGIPIFTVGFGPKHDNSTLLRIAELSDGRYYPAVDSTALEKVFSAIQNNLGNAFELTYKRPTQSEPSDLPVVSIVVDNSGSMDLPPEEEGCNYRIDKVKNLLHQFLLDLPPWSLVQLQSFAWSSDIPQVMTDERVGLLQGVSEMEAVGGTDIFGSTTLAFNTLQPIPSTKKIMIYITDAALAVPEEDMESFSTVLKKFKDNQIKTIWVGLGMEEEEEAFATSAELSGGSYVISEDPAELAKTFSQVIQEIAQIEPDTENTAIRLVLREQVGPNKLQIYPDSKLVRFPPPPLDQSQTTIESATIQTGFSLREAAQSVGVGTGLNISKSVPLGVSATNTAVEIKANSAVMTNRIGNLAAPSGMQFVAFDIELTNILPVQEVVVYPDGGNHPASWVGGGGSEGKNVRMRPAYLIPDLSSHLHLNWSNEEVYQATDVTWLTSQPLLIPGERRLVVEPDQPVRGYCVFIVPEEPMMAAALNFYDTAYGHMALPLVGDIKQPQVELVSLPVGEPLRLSDSFSLEVTAVSDVEQIGAVSAESGSLFRIVEADLTSKVQALLEIDPKQVFTLRIPTESGAFVIPMHPSTKDLPFGFVQPRMVAPGSFNRIRLAFQIPAALAEEYADLLIDLKENDFHIPLQTPGPALQIDDSAIYNGEAIGLVVNELASLSEDFSDDCYVVADVTFIDAPDESGTFLGGILQLVRDDYEGFESQFDMDSAVEGKGLGGFAAETGMIEYLLETDEMTEKLLLGFGQESAVRDGETRRGIVVFHIPEEGLEHQWCLTSPFFPELRVDLDLDAIYTRTEYLAKWEGQQSESDDFEQRLDRAIAEAIKDYQALASTRSETGAGKRIDLDSQAVKESIAPPPLALEGYVQFAEITALDRLEKILRDVRWLPSVDFVWKHRYAPEAVLTQRWGTEADLANMVKIVLARMGYDPEERVVNVTEAGREALLELGKVDEVLATQLPAVSYLDTDGQRKLIVLPFLKDYAELDGLVERPDEEEYLESGSETLQLAVTLYVKPETKDIGSQFKDMAGALGGGADEEAFEEITVFSESLPLDESSLDALDIGYTYSGRDSGPLVTAVVETARKKIIGTESVDTGLYKVVGERIAIYLQGQELIHETMFKEGESLDGIFHTVGINLPDMESSAVALLEESGQRLHNRAANPDQLSALRWYTRNIVNQFVVAQSQYESELAEDLGLNLGRTGHGRCLMVTLRGHADTVETSIDLLSVANEVHRGEQEARNAFNIFSGLFASRLESALLAQGSIYGLFEVWAQLPPETDLVWVGEDNREEFLALARDHEWPEGILERLERTQELILIPTSPAFIHGQPRWAWIKVDPETYWSLSVLDTGQNGASAEYAIGEYEQELGTFILGSFFGLDAANWSVSTFSLVLDDYKEILAAAEKFALSLADNYAAKFNIGGLELTWGIGATKPDVSLPLNHKLGFSANDGLKASVSPDFGGFGNGYKGAIKLYFAAARK